MPLPTQICVGPDQYFPVTPERITDGRKGYVELVDDDGRIGINEDIPEAGQHLILLHEILHVAEEKLIAAGVISEGSREVYIESLAGTLFPMLALSGLWKGVDEQDVYAFYSDVPSTD